MWLPPLLPQGVPPRPTCLARIEGQGSRINFTLANCTAMQAITSCSLIEDSGLPTHIPIRCSIDLPSFQRCTLRVVRPPSIPCARLGTMQLGSGAGNGYGGQKNPGAPQWHGMTLTSFGLWGRGGTNLRGLGQWQPLSAGQEGALFTTSTAPLTTAATPGRVCTPTGSIMRTWGSLDHIRTALVSNPLRGKALGTVAALDLSAMRCSPRHPTGIGCSNYWPAAVVLGGSTAKSAAEATCMVDLGARVLASGPRPVVPIYARRASHHRASVLLRHDGSCTAEPTEMDALLRRAWAPIFQL